MARYDYNMVAIGGGAAGLVTSYICAATKAKVALIEKHKMGGDCLNTGCIPSKTLIRTAKLMKDISRAKHLGLKTASGQVDLAHVMERIQRVIGKIEPHDSMERYQSLGVECHHGEAQITSPHSIEVNGKTLFTKHITIATGASPIIPDIPGMETIKPLTSETLWQLDKSPDHLVILGGGPIGCEMAQAFSRLGVSVTLIEKGERLLQKEDPEVSYWLADHLQKEGVTCLFDHQLTQVENKEGATWLHMRTQDGQERSLQCDQLLLALGRRANTKGFGLEKLGVELNSDGTLKTDAYLRLKGFKNLYACGDVAGPMQFTHAAAHQAWYCAVNSMLKPFWGFKKDMSFIPWATYTDPEVARLGLNEQEAKLKNIPYEVSTYDLGQLDRALTDEAAQGFVKVLTRPKRDQILGVTIVAERAGDMIAEFVLAMKHGLGLNKILSTPHAYPTWSEANKFAAGNWRKNQVTPRALLWGERINRWRR